MRFALRDDDTNYFTRPEQIEKVYAPLWDRCPLSLAVVPFHGCARTGAIPEARWSGEGAFPLHRNAELVAFLRRRVREGRISILLHGFDHVDAGGRPEFASAMRPAELERRILVGRRYLEELLETRVDTFVPPHNEVSRAALAALSRLSMNLLGSFSFRPFLRPMSPSILAPMARRRLFLWRESRRGWRGGFYPYPLEVGGHLEMACHNLNHDPACSLGELRLRLEQTRRVEGDFCLATHYWELTDPLLRTWLSRLIDLALDAGARFVHAGAFFARASGPAGREEAA